MPARIGITTSFVEGEQRLHHTYVRAVVQAGGLPIIVPMLEDEAAMHDVASLLDGLLITGGPAVTDGLMGELPEDLSPTDPIRLRSDMGILEAVLAAHKPVLGICYGMQLLNARFGGTIYADVEVQCPGTMVHSAKRGATTHAIHIQTDSVLYEVLQHRELEVNTRHIQAVATPGAGFRVSASAPDGVIEAIENDDGTLLGVQFHPERMGSPMLPLFRHLVACARRSSSASVALPP